MMSKTTPNNVIVRPSQPSSCCSEAFASGIRLHVKSPLKYCNTGYRSVGANCINPLTILFTGILYLNHSYLYSIEYVTFIG